MLFGSKKKEPQEEEIAVEKPPTEETPAEEPPVEKTPTEKPPVEETETPQQNEWDRWLVAYYKGKGRETWQDEMVEPLTKMLDAKDQTERILAAKILVTMGKGDVAMPVLAKYQLPTPPCEATPLRSCLGSFGNCGSRCLDFL
jgi:hypothetical protein